MRLELRFTAGRYHATPWGRHPNEAAPEWPPSPFRIVRALLDCWYRKYPDTPADVVERMCRALAVPPVFSLPPAGTSHTRSYLPQNAEDPSERKLVFDGFVVVDPATTIGVGWPGESVDPAARQLLATLASSLGYLGRSESWIDARLIEDDDAIWNCRPYRGGAVPAQHEVVQIAGIVSPDEFDTMEPIVTGKGKKAKTLSWFESLTWGSREAIDLAMSRPPALKPMLYIRRFDALRAEPVAPRPRPSETHGARYRIEGKVRAPVTESLEIAERIRRKLMGISRRRNEAAGKPDGTVEPLFAGKDAAGAPLMGHRHASILPLDLDGDGWIDQVLVIVGEALDTEAVATLRELDRVWQRGRDDLALTLIRAGARSSLLAPAIEVESSTPFIPTHHRRATRDPDEHAWAEAQLRMELARRGLPDPAAVRIMAKPMATMRAATRWLDFRRNRKGTTPRIGYGFHIRFREPVPAPFSVGEASHFGLGAFVPSRASAGSATDADTDT